VVHISMAASEEALQDHINDLVRNIREQAAQQARADLAAVWKQAALKAAQARLEAFGGSGADDCSVGRQSQPRLPDRELVYIGLSQR
jgi:hypothetical protein